VRLAQKVKRELLGALEMNTNRLNLYRFNVSENAKLQFMGNNSVLSFQFMHTSLSAHDALDFFGFSKE
jgi:hypothetical protein